LFLGSTIGNFAPLPAIEFLRRLRQQMSGSDWLLLGLDTVKDVEVLNAAYNDRQGVTAAFNKNVLRVINRELRADFELENFRHVAFFNAEQSQIEMYLEANRAHRVRIAELEMTVEFESQERILTEISHKFTERSASATLKSAGLELCEWFVPEDSAFALGLCRPG
jgi:L-histidine N-alpha-methyltransferase